MSIYKITVNEILTIRNIAFNIMTLNVKLCSFAYNCVATVIVY